MKVKNIDKDKVSQVLISIVNRGGKAVVQRRGEGIIIMEEHRQIRYKSDDDEAE